MNLNELAKEIHENAVKHGWWEGKREFPEVVALCHSELSEALEEYRNDNKDFSRMFYIKEGKPEGMATEMIDCIIRILDWCEHEGINVEQIVKIKNDYNKTRPYKHGGKKI